MNKFIVSFEFFVQQLKDYFGAFFAYLESEFRKNDKYILIILNQKSDEILKDAMRWNLDGLILCNHHKDVMVDISSQYLKPVVTIDASFVYEYNKLVQIFVDDYNGGYITGKFLASAGHRNVAMIDDTDYEADRHRWRGFRKAFEDAGMKPSDNPRADELRNANISESKQQFAQDQQFAKSEEEEKLRQEEQNLQNT